MGAEFLELVNLSFTKFGEVLTLHFSNISSFPPFPFRDTSRLCVTPCGGVPQTVRLASPFLKFSVLLTGWFLLL